ncbi:hypothetical protein [Limosilactobacillus fermentum]|uniref:hypothetical protein n=1 Tax=Limosilactobacillus fermentum TaxID=1613 RepID=UPI0013631069|nr:hypothetical protein [Limosilactobacillus fermentum]MCZ2327107.1 hypothetical protein [Limosilactobacillus fermentum]
MESEKLFKVLANTSFAILLSAITSIFATTIKATCIVTAFLIFELVVVAVILAFDDYTLRKKFKTKIKGSKRSVVQNYTNNNYYGSTTINQIKTDSDEKK